MGAKSYYDILNVPQNASESEIKKGYRTLTKKYHPDVCKEEGAEERFKEINEAYATLSDPQKRAQYDRMGHDAFSHASKGSYQGTGGFGGGFQSDFSGFGDIFDAFFGGSRRSGPQGPRQGSDLLMRIRISLRDAVFGIDREIDVMHNESCPDCDGTGSSTKKTKICSRCGGTGQERRTNTTPFGQFVSMATCSQCGGKGKIPEEECKKCRGSGHSSVKKTITVTIPSGIDTGMRLRMEGYGEAGDPGAPNGDLFIEVSVRPDTRFTRNGDNLETSVSITPSQAALGTHVLLKTLDEREINLKVPSGVQYNTALKISGEGVRRRGRAGDLLVRIRIVIPSHLSEEEKELYSQLMELDKERPSKKEEKGFFKDLKNKVKDSVL